MKLHQFNFSLPSELIAQSPAEPRDSARLLVYNRQTAEITHSTVKNITNFLPAQATLVVNNSKVRRGRLFGQLGSKQVEVLVLEETQKPVYRCLLRGRNFAAGQTISFNPFPFSAVITQVEEHPAMTTFLLSFESKADIEQLFEKFGHTPLPPYINATDNFDEHYQTVYAKELGSAAAPTAGLHFTPALIRQLRAQGFGWEEITLHVGIGTFLPLRQEIIQENNLHQESTYIPQSVAEKLTRLHQHRQPILAVGTTSARTLESHFHDNSFQAGQQHTELFIYPGFQYQAIDALMTNFHLPKSSLLLLVAAFLGGNSEEEMIEKLHHIYSTAIKERYRFFSFGDAMLIL